MKRFHILLFFSLLFFITVGQENEFNHKPTFLLTGASFASPNNGWFELGCEVLGANSINRAVGGEAIADAANRMNSGTLYSQDELENIDAFIIMQVHNKDVFDESQLKRDYKDYETPFNRDNYAAAFDYVIKRYQAECYNLKFNEKSKYYNTRQGKPAVIVLCTDWHDLRDVYNTSVRKLGHKWGFPIVEFDKFIGFSKNTLHPITNEQISRIYSSDTQVSNEEVFGWHPESGKDKYIQKRMAAIFADTMQKIFIFQ